MEPIEGVTFLQGDFREARRAGAAAEAMDGRLADVVVSDMAPNLSGIASADAARIAHLIELAIDFAHHHMKPEGALVAKLFHGSGYSELTQAVQGQFPRRQADQTQGVARQIVRNLHGRDRSQGDRIRIDTRRAAPVEGLKPLAPCGCYREIRLFRRLKSLK